MCQLSIGVLRRETLVKLHLHIIISYYWLSIDPYMSLPTYWMIFQMLDQLRLQYVEYTQSRLT